MKTSDVLNKTADVLQERGWMQGGGGWFPEPDSTGPLCIEGALTAVLGRRHKFECPAWRAVAEHLASRPGLMVNPHSGLPVVWVWNDAYGRTAAEVIEVLRATAVIEAAREEAAAREQVPA